jgi:hypothetical protein
MVRMMKALVMKRVGGVGAMEKAVPGPGPNDALVKTAALIYTGLCPGGADRMTRLLLGSVADKMLRGGHQRHHPGTGVPVG